MEHNLASASKQIRAQSFALLYTSLMIIVLTFVVGALFKYPSPPEKVDLLPEKPVVMPAERVFSELNITTLFEPRTAELLSLNAGALKELLLNHDVNLQVEVFLEEGWEVAEAMPLALARVTTLYDFLIGDGVPLESIKVYARPVHANEQIKLTLLVNGEDA